MAYNWSLLLPEMLEKIGEKCLSMDFKDFVMFSCVCCSWQRAAAVVVKSTVLSQGQIPWMLLPNDHGKDDEPDDNNDRRNLFDLRTNKWYNVSLPQASKRRCYGTGSQWILTVGLDREIQLLNFQTRALLCLPSCETFADPPDPEPTEEEQAVMDEWYREQNRVPAFNKKGERFRFSFIERAFVVHLDVDPLLKKQEQEQDSSLSLLVVVIYGPPVGYVAVAKPKDSKWTPVIGLDDVCDAVYCPTSGLMLFLQRRGKLICCDLHQLSESTRTTNCGVGVTTTLSLADYAPPPSFITEEADYDRIIHYEMLYLIYEPSSGDILLVRRLYDADVPDDHGHEDRDYAVAAETEDDHEQDNNDGDNNEVDDEQDNVNEGEEDDDDDDYYFHELEDYDYDFESRRSEYTCEFEVYKLDLQTKEWKELDELGDDIALFLGNSPATTVKTTTTSTTTTSNGNPNPKPNSIYFNDDGLSLYAYPGWGPEFNRYGSAIGFKLGGQDMGVYDVADGTISHFYPGDNEDDYLTKYSPPIWLLPKL